MHNLIETIWHQPEILTWQLISQQTSPKVQAAAREAAASAGASEAAAASALVGASAAADRKCQIVLECIWNWNLT